MDLLCSEEVKTEKKDIRKNYDVHKCGAISSISTELASWERPELHGNSKWRERERESEGTEAYPQGTMRTVMITMAMHSRTHAEGESARAFLVIKVHAPATRSL